MRRSIRLLAAGAALLAAAEAAAALPSFSLRDTRGRLHTAQEWQHARAVVLIFVTPDCPISQSYVPEMNRIAQAYAPKGVLLYAVQGDASYAGDAVRRHAEEYGYRFPVLLDPRQALVGHADATTTPEAFVLSPDGQVLYRGRIDNRVVSLGTRRQQATEHDLRNALEDVLAERQVRQPKTTAVGCIIDRRAPPGSSPLPGAVVEGALR